MNNPLSMIYEIPQDQQVWFIRTKSGMYYQDFVINNYVALGWNKVSADLIKNKSISSDSKKETIKELYPDENRPGLIYSQLYSFHCKMKKGDLVLIPSAGTKLIRLGVLGDVMDNVKHFDPGNEYVHCDYSNIRAVEWKNEIDTNQDVYLAKMIKVQQTISNITEYKSFVYRNIFPFYYVDNSIHFTLKKTTYSEFGISSSLKLQDSIISIVDLISELYNIEKISDNITIKMAVGSPGFWELISPYSGEALVAMVSLFFVFMGKIELPDGTKINGILGFLHMINNYLNDQVQRKKTKAETETIDAIREASVEKIHAEAYKTMAEACDIKAGRDIKYAEAEKTKAEAEKIRAETAKIKAETNLMIEDSENRHKNEEIIQDQLLSFKIPTDEETARISKLIEDKSNEIQEVLKKNGIEFVVDNDLIN